MILNNELVHWFRDSSAYIHTHRNKTFVVFFGGEAVLAEDFEQHIHDFALLNNLGVRLVLVHGIRPQIDQQLSELNQTACFHQHQRITDDIALQCVKIAVGLVRVKIESLLSFGVSASPSANAKINIVSGNFITAKPKGVIDGVDYQHTGEIRRVDTQAIQAQLKQNNVVLLSPIGYSPSGEIFNLSAERVATETAIALQAEKLILLTEQSYCYPENGEFIQQITTTEAEQLLQEDNAITGSGRLSLQAAIDGCLAGVQRVHLINRRINGALLLELFTRNGVGTLISLTPFETLRPAVLNDITGILELIKPLEQQGVLARRSREKIETELADYLVIERDGLIIGCGALHIQDDYAVCASLAVHADYRGAAYGDRLLNTILQKAKQQGIKAVFVLSTQTMHWFIERGFIASDINSLPNLLKARYNPQRNSKILCKKME
jgi:amino-acid N-acetyltransferase